MKKALAILLTLAMTFSILSVAFAEDYTIAVVPKMTSIAWFQRMEVGVNEYKEATGVDAFYTGPSEGDGALQVLRGVRLHRIDPRQPRHVLVQPDQQ